MVLTYTENPSSSEVGSRAIVNATAFYLSRGATRAQPTKMLIEASAIPLLVLLAAQRKEFRLDVRCLDTCTFKLVSLFLVVVLEEEPPMNQSLGRVGGLTRRARG